MVYVYENERERETDIQKDREIDRERKRVIKKRSLSVSYKFSMKKHILPIFVTLRKNPLQIEIHCCCQKLLP